MPRLVAAVVAAGVGLLPLATGARADEVYLRPAGTVLTFDGHGWGHGRGMSQWGAYGAAIKGLSWQQILDFYYHGTTQTTTYGNPTVAVRLDALGTSATVVSAAPGLQVGFGRPAGASVPLPTSTANGAISSYKVVRSGAGLRLQGLDAKGWQDLDVLGGGKVPATPYVFSNPTTGSVTALGGPNPSRTYAGTLLSYPNGSALMTVNELPMDSYLRGVVPSEMPSSWSAPALAAQAVAARTYAAQLKSAAGTRSWDLCDTTSCQVYKGLSDGTSSNQAASTTAAITATSGTILTYGGTPAFTEFSASNGGYTTAGSFPYIVAKPDPYDGVVKNSANSWSVSVPVASIERAYKSIGTFTGLRILSRDGNGDWGGRVLSMAVDGTAGSVTMSGTAFANAFGLKHQWFVPTNATVPAVATLARISGADRVGTANAASLAAFAKAGSASAAVIASSEGFADGLAGGPLARSVGGPLLLSARAAIDDRTLAELQRVLAPGGTAYLLGGEGALSPAVADAVTGAGFKVVRIGGPDRYATAVQIATAVSARGGSGPVLLTSGTDFPDALSASPAAAAAGGVVLLTNGPAMPQPTADYLAAHPTAGVYAVGGPSAAAVPALAADHRLVGQDRYETSVLTAKTFGAKATSVAFASGENYPDALSGGALAGLTGSPMLLVSAANVPPAVAGYLAANPRRFTVGRVFGGEGVVSPAVFKSLQAALNK